MFGPHMVSSQNTPCSFNIIVKVTGTVAGKASSRDEGALFL